MKVLLLQLDGKTPNLALMKIAGHHIARGDDVELRHAPTVPSVERGLWDDHGTVYASLIFTRTKPVARRLLQVRPDAVVGGTGWDLGKPATERMTLERIGVDARPDYSVYPDYRHSIGFTQRGCRLNCPFCDVPAAEGRVKESSTVWDVWRGEPWPRHLLLLDNDFFGQPSWRMRIAEIREGGFKVCFNQGVNARLLDDESAAALASVNYSDDQFKTRRLYTAWDNRRDEDRLFRNLELLARHGVKPDDILVYMLLAYWPGETEADWLYRQRRLREFGCRPYPMPYVRTDATRGFQRWVVGAYDKRFGWDEWKANGYRPEGLRPPDTPLFDEE